MAPRLTDKQRKRAVNDALLSKYMRQSNLSELLRRHPRHRATPLLAPLVEDQGGLTRSELEDEFIDFCQRYALPRPQVNVTVGGYLVDAFFEAERLIVELDSWRFHSGRQSFERDRNRDADALSQGIGTVRITHERLHTDPDGEAERLLKILQQRRGR
jgi:very-short-patch-repair endonuclease